MAIDFRLLQKTQIVQHQRVVINFAGISQNSFWKNSVSIISINILENTPDDFDLHCTCVVKNDCVQGCSIYQHT